MPLVTLRHVACCLIWREPLWENYLRGVSSELKVQTSVLYDMVLERKSTQPFLTRDEIDTIIGNICSN